ncbi:MAG: hypothetical protein EA369_00705 [Bradymonadales bacterium]|nr:MAG: hypothetical protein EA369_00705 [Bradymonadales bacterium]
MKPRKHVWIQVNEEVPRSFWWAEFLKGHSWAERLIEEKWAGESLRWAQVVDSSRSFTLFARQKLLLISQADKALKTVKKIEELFQEFQDCPHVILLLSESAPPKAWPFEQWVAPEPQEDGRHEKAIFRWMDQIDRSDLRSCLRELELSLDAGQHPLALLQMLTRHYRMGRLVTYAVKKGLSEAEITRSLKLPGFVIQKWRKAPRYSQTQWTHIFHKLSEADLFLKSGYDEKDVLRKLSHDLCQIRLKKMKLLSARPARPGFLFGSPLLQVSPSFF